MSADNTQKDTQNTSFTLFRITPEYQNYAKASQEFFRQSEVVHNAITALIEARSAWQNTISNLDATDEDIAASKAAWLNANESYIQAELNLANARRIMEKAYV